MRSTNGRSRIHLLLSLLLLFAATRTIAGQSVGFADGLTYNNFYAVTVHTDAGESFTLFDAAWFAGEAPPWPDATGSFGDRPGAAPDRMNYFMWVRRVGEKGALTYPLSFNKIQDIRFIGPYGGIAADAPVTGTLKTEGMEDREITYREDGRRLSGWFSPDELEPSVPSFTPAVLTLTDVDEATGDNVRQTVYVKTDGFLGGIDEEFGTYGLLWLRHDGVERLEFHHDGTYVRCPLCGSIFFDDRNGTCPFDGTPLVPQLTAPGP